MENNHSLVSNKINNQLIANFWQINYFFFKLLQV